MIRMYRVVFVILGMCLASFYHVLAVRTSNNKSIIKPASHCDYCKKKLKWYELIPVFSYIFQGGMCNYCHKKLPLSYLISEILLGFMFGFGYYMYGISYELFAFLIIVSLMDIIFISDFKYLVILDYPLFISIILIIILKLCYFGFTPTIKAVISGAILVIFMILVKMIGDRVYKKESLGWGDIKLALFMGCTLGIKLGFVALIIGSFVALPYAIYYVMQKKEKEIPYGPFLITAVLIVFIFMDQLSVFINNFFVIS